MRLCPRVKAHRRWKGYRDSHPQGCSPLATAELGWAGAGGPEPHPVSPPSHLAPPPTSLPQLLPASLVGVGRLPGDGGTSGLGGWQDSGTGLCPQHRTQNLPEGREGKRLQGSVSCQGCLRGVGSCGASSGLWGVMLTSGHPDLLLGMSARERVRLHREEQAGGK